MRQGDVAPAGVCLGAAPLGSGNDWARAQHIPADAAGMARCVAAGRAVLQDIGRLDFPLAGPGERTCHFINVAGAGLDGYVLERLPRRVPRRMAYLAGVLRSLVTFRAPMVELDAEGHRGREHLLLAMLALGPYCGGGMRLAPMASTDDGVLDLLTVRPLRLPAELLKLRRLFDGRLPEESFARYARVREARITADPPAIVQADGQIVGRTPFIATLLPRAILTLRA
jgi:diacylglycerol kinase family enzyme